MRSLRLAILALCFACATPAVSPVVTVAPAHHRLGSVLSSYTLTVVENEDFGPLTFTYYTDAANTIPFNFTGYSASMMIRDSILTSPALTITPTLGGALGTLSIARTTVVTTTK